MFSLLPFLTDSDELLDQWTIALLAIIVIYLGWRSTYVREDRPQSQAAVLVIENNLHHLNRIAQQPVTINILRSSSQQSNISNVTETEELDLENDSIASSIDNITQSILTEASESATGLDLSDSEAYPSTSGVSSSASGGPSGVSRLTTRSSLNEEIDPGPEEIIRQMDQDLDDTLAPVQPVTKEEQNDVAEGVRQRKNAPNITSTTDTIDGQLAEGSDKTKDTLESKQIRIKLKFLNDDSKLVEGNLNEGIGDFKKRNFSIELAAKKLVRLVFNGHVLQPDTKTLAACGLFDNCVVHCLIHNPKPQTGSGELVGTGGILGGNDAPNGVGGFGNGVAGNGNDQQIGGESTWRNRLGSYFIYIGTFILSATIAYCWYCRFQYGHLFNLNSTIGLIVTTTIFLIMMPTIILTDSNSTN
ncbi:uncharacterized protein LOC129744310 [Uranotaenia lowii]|uniref:uncharacterized protein LOC129744310 n=1 Tax=Uranotaenia lowii TaxID=190385 RepID=UPI0024797E93|nr:uncharacterized protein LOC129744310 [Uranotaenia lowii]